MRRYALASSPLLHGLSLLASLAAGTAFADAPAISSITPRGAQRGKAVTITVDGANLAAGAELLVGLPGLPRLLTDDAHKPAAGRLSFELLVNETDAPGAYPLRVRTEDGLSNPVLFLVGVFPEVLETEPNDVPEAAQPLQLPVTVNGSLGPTDRDTFRFNARAGERLSFEVEARRIGSAVDPTLHVLLPNGRELAMSEDTPGLNVDCRIDFTPPSDGEYLVQVHDAMYLSQAPSFYRLKAGAFRHAEGVFPLGGRRGSDLVVNFEGGNLQSPLAERVRLDPPPSIRVVPVGLPFREDNGGGLPFNLRVGDLPEVFEAARAKPEEPQPFPAPSTMNGRIEKRGEVDRYLLAVKPGERWLFEVEAQALGSLLDGVLEVQRPDGGRLAVADDNGTSADPRLEFAVPEGVTSLVLALEDLHHRGGPGFAYRLTARPSRPDFLLTLGTPTVNLPLGGTEVVLVDVVRRGYNGPVRLELVSPPGDVAIRGGRVSAGQAKGAISITAPPRGPLSAMTLAVRGVGEGDVDPALATATIFLAGDRGVPVSPMAQSGVALAFARPLPLALRVEEGPVRVVAGHAQKLAVAVARAEGASGALKIQPVVAPAGITIAEAAVADTALEGTVTLTAAPDAPLGVEDAVVRAAGKVGGKDLAVPGPVFRVQVVPPFTAEIARVEPLPTIRAVEGSVGGVSVLEGTVRREPPFAGEVELKLDGIPAGMTAPAVVVPPTQSAFRIMVAWSDPVKASKAEVKLVATTKLGDPKKPAVFAAAPVPVSLGIPPPAQAADAAKVPKK